MNKKTGTELLHACQRCRNSMMYLMDGSAPNDESLLRIVAARLRSLPDLHDFAHRAGGKTDTETPTPCRGATS